MNPFLRYAGAALLALGCAAAAHAASAIGPAALRTRHATLAPQLATNAFGGPLVLKSEEATRRIEGDVYAVLDHPFEVVNRTLSDPGRWCDILILHLNIKYCRRIEEGGANRLEVRVGRKHPQAVQSASLLGFAWHPPQARPDYLFVQMDSPQGPYDTRDYQLMVEAVPLEGNRTFLHMGYGLSYGGSSRVAMQLYLATMGRDKVGFTKVRQDDPESYVEGMRGVVERNTMRYYLAIDAYLDSLSLPPERQLEKRLQAWFDATERYPRQLHEVGRDDYLQMKRDEVQRQARR